MYLWLCVTSVPGSDVTTGPYQTLSPLSSLFSIFASVLRKRLHAAPETCWKQGSESSQPKRRGSCYLGITGSILYKVNFINHYSVGSDIERHRNRPRAGLVQHMTYFHRFRLTKALLRSPAPVCPGRDLLATWGAVPLLVGMSMRQLRLRAGRGR